MHNIIIKNWGKKIKIQFSPIQEKMLSRMECDLICGKGNTSAIDLYQYKIHVYFLIKIKIQIFFSNIL